MAKELKDIIEDIKVNQTWLKSFKHYVPLFIAEARDDKPWNRWDKKTFEEFFKKGNNQCISSLRQGYFDSDEQKKIKDKWHLLSPLLKQLADNQEAPNFELYEAIRKLILTCTKNNKRAAIRRLITSLQPRLLSTILSNDYVYEGFVYINANVVNGESLKYTSGDNKTDNWFKNSHELLKFYQDNLPDQDPLDIVTLPWQTRELFSKKDSKESVEDDENDSSGNDFISKTIKILKYKHQIILQGPPGTGKTHTAKEIAKRLTGEKHFKEQCKIIQFHPAYSYEDFVRGIVADTEDGQVTYSVQNRLLANFAEEAHQNYIDSQKEIQQISQEQRLNTQMDDFVEYIAEQLQEQNSNRIQLTENIYIVDVEEDAFRYGGTNWTHHPRGLRLKFNTIKQAYLNGNETRKDISSNNNLNRLARNHSTYTEAILNKFKSFIQQNAAKYPEIINSNAKVERKNYVLIIDEINRANLPAVLGELIYALEYRDQAVNSMYAIDEATTLILPKNLYIIGTMNTVDRSIGSIDYAIRRRFAFINILPQVLSENFQVDLFKKVSSLFIDNLDEYTQDDILGLKRSSHLSEEFEPEDVWLGHSYFMVKEIEDITNRINYEIKPILKEYVKDGILKETALDIINSL